MKYVDRQSIPPPKVFGSIQAREARAALLQVFGTASFETMAQTRASESISSYSVAHEAELVGALERLFRGRCAFCEIPVEEPLVHRFRPLAHAEPAEDTSTSHLYYSWLAEAWQNLYPVCQECVPTNDSYFPVYNKRSTLPDTDSISNFASRDDGLWPSFPLNESPVLLDPCEDRNLWRSLGFDANGTAIGRTRRGIETIENFKLNRASLVERRRSAFNEAIAYTRMDFRGEERRRLEWMQGIKGHEGAIEILLREAFARALGQRPKNDIARQRADLLRTGDEGLQQFDRAIDELRRLSEPSKVPTPLHRRTEPDFFRSIEIRNFKSLEHIVLKMPKSPEQTSSNFEAPALLILGENAAGKSTILEAIALSVMSTGARERLKLTSSQLILNPTFLGGETKGEARLASVDLTFSDEQKRTVTFVATQNPRDQVHEEGLAPNIPVFGYGAYRQYLDKERTFAPHKHIRSLFEPDELLSNPEKWLSGLSKPYFDMVVRALREVFRVDGSFDVIQRSDTGIFVISHYFEGELKKTRREPISLVSSGFRAILAMLCDIMQGLMDERVNPGFESLETARGLVLIDEVEAHLHPRWKMSILTGLRRALPRVTFIATSHDPLCLRGMGKDEVLVLQRVSGEAEQTELPVITQTLTNLPDNEKWTVEQLLTADFFQLRTTESTDAEKRAARMEDKLAQGILPSEDAELAAYLAEFSRDLPIGHTEVHRLVQDAIAKFLRLKRKATKRALAELKVETRNSILDALKSVG